jgi:hypothetical protein
MSYELERIWKEAVVAEARYYPIICPERQKETVRIADVPVEIQTEHLPNSSLNFTATPARYYY